MSKPLKQRQVLSSESPLEQDSAAQQPLAAKQVAEQQSDWLADDSEQLQSLDIDLQPKSSKPWLKYGFSAALVMALLELGLSLFELWQSSPLRAGIYSALLTSILLGALGFGIKELAKLRRLKRYQKQRLYGQTLMAAEPANNQPQNSQQARAYCEQLASLQQCQDTPEYQHWQQYLQEHHNSSEIVSLYSETVLAPMDLRAKQAISKWSSEAAILVAISPLAMVDMLIIFWRNLKMIEEVADIYGIELGYFSRIRLTKKVFVNMIYAAASEVISDLGSDLLGAELTAKLSSKAAQGIGAGLLTARLGFKTMEQCRPIPWTKNNRPKTKQLKAMLLEKVKQKLSTKN